MDTIFEDDLVCVDLTFATAYELAYFMMSEQEKPLDKEALKKQQDKQFIQPDENSSAAQ